MKSNPMYFETLIFQDTLNRKNSMIEAAYYSTYGAVKVTVYMSSKLAEIFMSLGVMNRGFKEAYLRETEKRLKSAKNMPYLRIQLVY